MKKKPIIYVLDSRLKWSIFKELQSKFVKKSGIYAVHMDKILWQMMRDKKIFCWFDALVENDMGMGLELPKGRECKLLTNPK